jgi:hypothetical protein
MGKLTPTSSSHSREEKKNRTAKMKYGSEKVERQVEMKRSTNCHAECRVETAARERGKSK